MPTLPKITMVLPVRFSFETRAVQTTTREISAEGVFVRCLQPPQLGMQVGLKLYLPGLAQAADFIGVVREVEPGKGEGGFWADFVSGEGLAHQRLLELLEPTRAGNAPRPPVGPVPIGSLYKRAHVQQPAPQAVTAPPPAPLPPSPAEATALPTPMTVLIQGALSAVVAEKAAEALAQRRGSTPGKKPSQPGRKSSQPGGKAEPAAPQAPLLPADAVPAPLPEAPTERKSEVVLAGDAINRRAFPRYRARFAVRFSSVQDFVLEYAANISAGGVFVITDHPPEMDAVITVMMELPDGGPSVACKALVVHRVTPEQAKERETQAGVGVQFVEADDHFRERIDQTIEQILGQGHP